MEEEVRAHAAAQKFTVQVEAVLPTSAEMVFL
jgi:hypothetical protein